MGFLKIGTVTRPEDGFNLEVLNKNNAVGIVLFNHNYSKILLTKQFRAGAGETILEIPAGIIEDGENPLNTAIREVREETGFENLDDITFLGEYLVSPGYTTEKMFLYKARVIDESKQLEQELDPNELIDLEWVDINDVYNKTNCMKTILGLTKALAIPKKKIGIFGGTFNPITNMHLSTVERAIDALELDKVIIEPVNDSYSYKTDMLPSKDRVEMVRRAVENNPKLELGTFESSFLVQPTTFKTLQYYQNKYGWAEIYFICGSDNLKSLDTWTNFKELLDSFEIICLQRNNDNVYQDIILPNKHLVKRKNNIHIVYENVVNNISASAIRNLIHNGESIKYLVPDSVISYIEENELYK